VSVKDLTQLTDDELSALSDADITELLPTVTDEAARDALVKVMWTRAARQAPAENPRP
jgi:hypothetical protein